MGGDFNEILRNTKKSGGNQRVSSVVESFREVIDDCNLKDVKFRGSIFTWNSRRHNQCIWERLDRFFSNPAFDRLFGNSMVTHLD